MHIPCSVFSTCPDGTHITKHSLLTPLFSFCVCVVLRCMVQATWRVQAITTTIARRAEAVATPRGCAGRGELPVLWTRRAISTQVSTMRPAAASTAITARAWSFRGQRRHRQITRNTCSSQRTPRTTPGGSRGRGAVWVPSPTPTTLSATATMPAQLPMTQGAATKPSLAQTQGCFSARTLRRHPMWRAHLTQVRPCPFHATLSPHHRH